MNCHGIGNLCWAAILWLQEDDHPYWIEQQQIAVLLLLIPFCCNNEKHVQQSTSHHAYSWPWKSWNKILSKSEITSFRGPASRAVVVAAQRQISTLDNNYGQLAIALLLPREPINRTTLHNWIVFDVPPIHDYCDWFPWAKQKHCERLIRAIIINLPICIARRLK